MRPRRELSLSWLWLSPFAIDHVRQYRNKTLIVADIQVTNSDQRDRDNSLAERSPTDVMREGDSPRNTTDGSDPRTATL